MYCLLIPEKWNQTSILIELKRKLFIHQKDIVHLCIEIRITVICDFVRLYICFPKNGIYRTFMYGGKPCKACCFRCFIDMGCPPGICPCFSCVSKISWFLAGEIEIHAFSSPVISAFLQRPGASKRAFSMLPYISCGRA